MKIKSAPAAAHGHEHAGKKIPSGDGFAQALSAAASDAPPPRRGPFLEGRAREMQTANAAQPVPRAAPRPPRVSAAAVRAPRRSFPPRTTSHETPLAALAAVSTPAP